jgi:2,3-bisphosphoglycerate-independent phosphoglycerate mutase
VKEYRLLLVLRGEGLGADLVDTDPQDVGVRPNPPEALKPGSKRTADLLVEFLDQAQKLLADHHPANMILLRGFAKKPDWPSFEDIFGLRSAAIAGYPMYRGVAKLVGMEALEVMDDLGMAFQALRER